MSVRVLTGDCRDVLKTLPDASVHSIVTSPPYYGLRDYGTGQWEGGNPECEHVVGEIRTGLGMAALSEKYRGGGKKVSEPKPMTAKDACPHCGATRIDRQIGLEASPAEFIDSMVAVFRECWRVLRDDGTLWLNMGDSYASSGGQSPQSGPLFKGRARQRENICTSNRGSYEGVKSKDLLGIPWMLAFALRADGWYLRQDIIWSKPNPMPESVRDRCTKAHEYLFLLSKSERYYFDAEAIAENALTAGQEMKMPDGMATYEGGHTSIHRDGREKGARTGAIMPEKRNKRSVWTIATQPFKEAHFATFPPALVEPCIKAGCPQGGWVLDPFGGAGTTGLVADRLQRSAILIELNPEYAAIAQRRIRDDAPLFAEARTA